MLKRLFLCIAMMVAVPAYAQSADEVVNNVMHEYMQKHEVPGMAVIVYTDGKPSAYYFGYADLETKKPITKDTIFELGSLTKLMTTLLLAQEVDFARMKLTDPVNKYIPTLPASFSTLTMRSLATHTSALPFKLPADVKTRVEWEENYAVNWKPASAPDKNYTYSNVGIGLIGQAIQTVTHESLDMLYRKKILLPLGMQPIGINVPEKLKVNYAKGYNIQGAPLGPDTLGLFPAAGDMKASAEDMGKFLSAAIGLPNTPEGIFYPMRMTQTAYLDVDGTAQGLAWQIHALTPETKKILLTGDDLLGLETLPVNAVFADPVFKGSDLIDKTGSTNGFRAYIAVMPNKKSGIVVLTNRNVPGSAFVLAAREILFKLNPI
jgi:beta-lactamase class C